MLFMLVNNICKSVIISSSFKFSGENCDQCAPHVTDIDDTDNFPPYHPNCRCTPRFSTKTVEERGG